MYVVNFLIVFISLETKVFIEKKNEAFAKYIADSLYLGEYLIRYPLILADILVWK